jgi:hypothetical protein
MTYGAGGPTPLGAEMSSSAFCLGGGKYCHTGSLSFAPVSGPWRRAQIAELAGVHHHHRGPHGGPITAPIAATQKGSTRRENDRVRHSRSSGTAIRSSGLAAATS